MSGLAGEVAIIRLLEQSVRKMRKLSISRAQMSDSQSVLSSHGQVESRLADVSLHSMNSLTRCGANEFGIEQFDDIWRVKSKDDLLCVCVWEGSNIHAKAVP